MNSARGAWAAALLAATLPALLTGCQLPPDVESVMAAAGGTSAADAYVVSSAEQEYEILRTLGLELRSRSVRMINGQPFDVLNAFDPKTGAVRDVWFDISRFFGR